MKSKHRIVRCNLPLYLFSLAVRWSPIHRKGHTLLTNSTDDQWMIAVYTIAGFICSVAGWALIGRIGAISAISGGNSNLDSITAVVIGGTSLFGGRGSIVGTLVGALVVGVFRNGLALAGADAPWQEFCIGVLIIVAVALDQWIRKVAA